LEGFNEEEFRQLEELKELFEFLDDVIPEEDDEDDKPEPRKRGPRKRLVTGDYIAGSNLLITFTNNRMSETVGSDADDGSPPSSKRKSSAKRGAK
jgi:condensin complex subunit 3